MSQCEADSSDDERELGISTRHCKDLFFNGNLQDSAAKISPRMGQFYHQLSKAFFNPGESFLEDDFQKKTAELFRSIQYQPLPSFGPFCNRQMSDKSYFCADCNIGKKAHLFCGLCFEKERHQGHYFIVGRKTRGNCDCGKGDVLKKESFCSRHREFKKDFEASNQKADLYQKEMEFVLYLLLRIKREVREVNQAHERHLWRRVFSIVKETIQESYVYQLKTSELLLKPFSEPFRYECRPLIEILFAEEWSSLILNQLASIYIQLSSVTNIRKKILFELMLLFNSYSDSFEKLKVYSDSLFSEEIKTQKMILRLHQQRIVRPIASYQVREDFTQALQFSNIIFNWYHKLSDLEGYHAIVEIVLSSVPIASFFSLPQVDFGNPKGNETLRSNFKRGWVATLRSFLAALPKIPTRKQLLRKVIQESFAIVTQNSTNTLRCAERTLGMCLFVYFDFDLKNMGQCPLSDLELLLGVKTTIRDEKYLLSLLGMCEKVYSQQVCYSPLVSEKQWVAISFVSFQTLLLLVYAIDQELSSQGQLGVSRGTILDRYIEESARNSVGAFKKCKESNSTEGKLFLFGKMDFDSSSEKLAEEALKVIHLVKWAVHCFEGEAHQTILASYLGHHNPKKIKSIYRELACIHCQKLGRPFKQECEKWIPGKEFLQDFMANDFDSLRKGDPAVQEHYQSSITYFSLIVFKENSAEKISRFRSKLFSDNTAGKWAQFMRYFFSEQSCQRILSYFSPFTDVFFDHQGGFKKYIDDYWNRMTGVVISLFFQTKHDLLLRFTFELQDRVRFNNLKNFTDNYQQMMSQKLLAQSGAEKEEKLKRVKEKKMKILKNMKQQQEKVLEQINDKVYEEAGEDQHSCIICKESGKEKPLGFLSKVKYSNLLKSIVLGNTSPFLLITSCGHQIHKDCLIVSLLQNDCDMNKFECFLCKSVSNFFLPVDPSSFDQPTCKEFLSEFFSTLQREADDNGLMSEEFIQDKDICSLLIHSLAQMAHLYATCLPDLFKLRILPIFDSLIRLTRTIRIHTHQQTVKNEELGQLVGILQQIIFQPSNLNGHSFYLLVEEEMRKQKITEAVMARLESFKSTPSSKENELVLNLLALPKDLYGLSGKARTCEYCSQAESKLTACLLCGYKLCPDCKEEQMRNHRIQRHLGETVVIDLTDGHVHYHEEDYEVAICYLYINDLQLAFDGEELEVPAQGEFNLYQKNYKKLTNDLFLEAVRDKFVNNQKKPLHRPFRLH